MMKKIPKATPKVPKHGAKMPGGVMYNYGEAGNVIPQGCTKVVRSTTNPANAKNAGGGMSYSGSNPGSHRMQY